LPTERKDRRPARSRSSPAGPEWRPIQAGRGRGEDRTAGGGERVDPRIQGAAAGRSLAELIALQEEEGIVGPDVEAASGILRQGSDHRDFAIAAGDALETIAVVPVEAVLGSDPEEAGTG